jgi:hypothetical protein
MFPIVEFYNTKFPNFQILLWNHKPKDNYNMEEMGLLYT